jgi:hypothetical protein
MTVPNFRVMMDTTSGWIIDKLYGGAVVLYVMLSGAGMFLMSDR